MTNIIIHLGLTKTASTFLQKRIFGGKIFTFERKIDWVEDRYIAKDFQADFLRDGWSFNNAKYGNRFFESQLESHADIVISHESLFPHIPFTEDVDQIRSSLYLLCEKLLDIKENWNHGDLKVFFLYRRQVDWLPSMYANVAYRLQKPSSLDFNRKIQFYLDSQKDSIDLLRWDVLYSEISRVVGQDNVLALPYESFKEPTNWERIESFIGRSIRLDIDTGSDYSINSKRSQDGESWAMADKMQYLADVKLLQPLRPLAKRLFSHKTRLKVKKALGINNESIELSGDNHAALVEFFSASNDRLSKATGADLRELKYFE